MQMGRAPAGAGPVFHALEQVADAVIAVSPAEVGMAMSWSDASAEIVRRLAGEPAQAEVGEAVKTEALMVAGAFETLRRRLADLGSAVEREVARIAAEAQAERTATGLPDD